jgi:hypothetical protein
MRSRSAAILLGLALCTARGEARAENDAATAAGTADVSRFLRLAPPALLREGAPPARHVALPGSDEARARAAALSLDLSLSYLRLAVHGDHTPGFSTFLGTSTAALGGFRLRF